MERLFHDLGRMLRLAAIMCEALLYCAAATLSGFGLLFSVSFRGRHVALLASVVRLKRWHLSKRPCHRPSCVCENSVTSASRARRTSCFLLSTMCGIHMPERPVPFPPCLPHAVSA